MNSTNFIQTGGWPLNGERLQELQTAYSIFNAFGALAGNMTIISGCETVGTTVQKGFVFINGELYEFREAAVNGTSRVIIVEEAVNRPFENGTVKQVHTIRYATFGTSDNSWLWSDFKRPLETKSIQASLTNILNRLTTVETGVAGLNNRTSTIEEKLATIARGAEVNVQADWNETNVNSDAFIKNKQAVGNLMKGVVTVGDVDVDKRMVVTFPDIGITDYEVSGFFDSMGSDWDNDNDVIWSVKNRTRTSYELLMREVAPNIQNIRFIYTLKAR